MNLREESERKIEAKLTKTLRWSCIFSSESACSVLFGGESRWFVLSAKSGWSSIRYISSSPSDIKWRSDTLEKCTTCKGQGMVSCRYHGWRSVWFEETQPMLWDRVRFWRRHLRYRESKQQRFAFEIREMTPQQTVVSCHWERTLAWHLWDVLHQIHNGLGR